MKRTWASLSGALAIFALALAIRSIGIDQDPAGDELYTYFAAKQYVADGTLQIQHGEPYTRALAFTRLIALVQKIFGDSLVVNRIPAALFGSLTAALLFWWLKRDGHTLAAWLAGILAATAPGSLILSQQVRFYTAQQLAFLAGCVLCYLALEEGRSAVAQILLGMGSLAAVALAVHLQPVAIIGAAGLGIFALGVFTVRWARWIGSPAARWGMAVVLILAAALAVWGAVRFHLADEYSRLASHADLWAKGAVHKPRFYFWRLRSDYPAICMIFPLAALAAASSALRITLLSLSVFSVAFVVHSSLPWKADRYFEYAMPFFFVVGALAWAHSVPFVRRLVARVTERGWAGRSRRLRNGIEGVTLASLAVVLVLCNDGFERTAMMLRRDSRYSHPGMESGSLSWSNAAPALRDLAAASEVVVSCEDAKALFYLGRVDYVLNRDHVEDVSGKRPEFSSYASMGAPVFNTRDSLLRVLRCHRSGLLIVETTSWSLPFIVPRETAEAIEANLQPVELPPEYGLKVFRWTTELTGPATECPPRPEGGK